MAAWLLSATVQKDKPKNHIPAQQRKESNLKMSNQDGKKPNVAPTNRFSSSKKQKQSNVIKCTCFLCLNLPFYQCLDDCNLNQLFWHLMTSMCYSCVQLCLTEGTLFLSSVMENVFIITCHYLQICYWCCFLSFLSFQIWHILFYWNPCKLLYQSDNGVVHVWVSTK